MKSASIWAGILLMWCWFGSGAACAAAEYRSYDMTLSETEEVVTDWLKHNRYNVYRFDSSDRQVQLTAEREDTRLQIDLKPNSPLATLVRVDPLNSQDVAAALEHYLAGYLRQSAEPPAPADPPIPKAVREQLKAVVCLYAEREGADFQFSGFIIDPSGYIVCTAHDLNPHQPITVLLVDGRTLHGRVVRIDLERDLTLIKVDEPLEAAVALHNGRYMLRPGDTLFAITCPNSHRPIVQRGRLDGPPRSVQGFPLWQVDMHIDHGSSGSPVFDGNGCLAAVVKGRYRGTDSIGFLIPFETLVHFLEKN